MAGLHAALARVLADFEAERNARTAAFAAHRAEAQVRTYAGMSWTTRHNDRMGLQNHAVQLPMLQRCCLARSTSG